MESGMHTAPDYALLMLLHLVGALGHLPPDRVEKINLRGNDRISSKSPDELGGKFPGKVLRPVLCANDDGAGSAFR